MRRPTSDSAGETLSRLVDELEEDPAELARRALKVWRARSPALALQSKKRGESPVATATELIVILLGSLQSDTQLGWSDWEQRSREYGRLRARQAVPLESLLDELAVYRRATIELISTRLQENPGRDGMMALAHSRLADVTDHLNRSIAAGYLESVAARRPPKSRLAATVSAMGRRSSDIAQTARNGLGKTIAAVRRRARWPRLKAETVHLGDATRRVGRSPRTTRMKDAKRMRHHHALDICRSRA
jgi:hypothetical protein